MKKTTKKHHSKASKKAAKDLDVKPVKGGAVRGGTPKKDGGYA